MHLGVDEPSHPAAMLHVPQLQGSRGAAGAAHGLVGAAGGWAAGAACSMYPARACKQWCCHCQPTHRLHDRAACSHPLSKPGQLLHGVCRRHRWRHRPRAAPWPARLCGLLLVPMAPLRGCCRLLDFSRREGCAPKRLQGWSPPPTVPLCWAAPAVAGAAAAPPGGPCTSLAGSRGFAAPTSRPTSLNGRWRAAGGCTGLLMPIRSHCELMSPCSC
jgi:hypothetical protein